MRQSDGLDSDNALLMFSPIHSIVLPKKLWNGYAGSRIEGFYICAYLFRQYASYNVGSITGR